jgi:hypothetical protein
LPRQRLVDAELVPQLRDKERVRRSGFAGHDGCRVAGSGMDEHEIDNDDGGENENRFEQPVADENYIAAHGPLLLSSHKPDFRRIVVMN